MYLLKQATIVNEGKEFNADVLIKQQRIEKIASTIHLTDDTQVIEINCEGKYLIPGVIDDQVHFREPGLTHKATIASETRAAVAGGVTTFMDMPNTIPNTLTINLLEQKYDLASQNSLANYSFFMGVTQHNLKEVLKVNNEWVCGITDDGLYFNDSKGILANYPDYLAQLFAASDTLIALHSENDAIIAQNTAYYQSIYGNDIPVALHPKIRSEEACLSTTKEIIELAKKHEARLHVYHVSTKKEADLFEHQLPIRAKKITAEACVHHLWFTDSDYERLGGLIKWNPAVKTLEDKEGIWDALLIGKLDIIATDHAPHSWEEKQGNYFQIHSGGPLVQHSLSMMLEQVKNGRFKLTDLVQKMAHHPAEIYRMVDRGYIREGYYADLVLIDPTGIETVSKENMHYQCGWSPLEGETFHHRIEKTFVSGHCVYDQGQFNTTQQGLRVQFEKIRK